MERHYLILYLSSIIIFLALSECYCSNCIEKSSPIQSYIEILQNGLKYVNNSVTDLNIDIYFAILLTYVQLHNIKDLELITESLRTAEDILKNKNWMKHIDGDSYTNKNNLLSVDKWSDVPADNLTLKCESSERFIAEFDSVVELLLLTNTLPDEISFDKCLSELYNNKQNGLECSTGMCHNIMSTGRSYGYSVTHRLLYWLVCKIEGCNDCFGYEFDDKVRDLCCNIIEDSMLIDGIDFPVTLRDLFMEQVVLCTLSGYWNVMEERWINKVISWQSRSGCWDDFITIHKRINKRSSTYLGNDKCSSHATGLGVLFLALAARNNQC